MRIKHNKLKNTGLLYELLVRQITSDIINSNSTEALKIFKKYYNPNTELYKEHKLYNAIFNSKKLNESVANSLIEDICKLSTKISPNKLRKEKYDLIKEIKDKYNIIEFFKYNIKNYKELASFYNILEANNTTEFIEPKDIIKSKQTILEYLTQDNINIDEVKDQTLEEYAKLDKKTKTIAYNNLVESFNKKYEVFGEEQKDILKEYIYNLSNLQGMKDKVQYHIKNIQSTLNSYKELLEEDNDFENSLKIKIDEINKTFNKGQDIIKENHILLILNGYELINEIKSL